MKMSPRAESELKPENYQINAKICRLVEKFPCMYDRSHQHYLKKDVVDKAWVKISKEMDDSIPSCKERWRNIRTSFARSINVNKIPASANRTKPYYLHEELQFLARHITPGIPIPRRSNAYSSAGEESEIIEVSVGEDTFDGFALAHDDEEEADADDSQEQQEQEQSSSACDSSEPVKTEEKVEKIENVVNTPRPNTPIACPPKKRKRSIDYERPASVLEQKFSDHAAHDADFDSIFLQGLLPEMKAMDFRQKILFKRRIYEVIGEIFDTPSISTTASTTSPTTHSHSCHASSTAKVMAHNSCPVTPTSTPTMTIVNSADLAMIRRLNSLLQSPQSSMLTTMVAAPKSVCASISSTVRSAAPATATVAVNRGALTRSTANLLRVTMVNPPPGMSTQPNVMPIVVKEESETLDD